MERLKPQNADPHFGTICLCAMRYALGRETYMPGLVQDYIRAHIKEIDKSSIHVMIWDIDEADKITEHKLSDGSVMWLDGLGGTKIDRPGWERFREFLKERVEQTPEPPKEVSGDGQ